MSLSRKEQDRLVDRLNKIKREEKIIHNVLRRNNVSTVIHNEEVVLTKDWLIKMKEH